MKQNQSISAIKSGMSRDVHHSQLKGNEYIFAMNANTNNETEGFNIQNEPSDQYGLNFPAGYKVIGFKNDNLKEKIYYFLTNPKTKKSSIGYIKNEVKDTFNQDTQLDCPDCKHSNILSPPLELTSQVATLQYVKLLDDDCAVAGEGLDFDVNFPIKKIEIKQEKLGTYLYWTDYKNAVRYLNVSDVSYMFTQEIPCADSIQVTCPLFYKLLLQPNHKRLTIKPELIQLGGNLKRGAYEFHLVYCDLLGREITEYFTPTQPVKIFDDNNRILSQKEDDGFTNYAIKLRVKNLDPLKFKYYKVVCVERSNVDNTQSAFIEGIHPTTDDTIVYISSGSSSDDLIKTGNVSIKRRIDFNTLSATKARIKTAKGLMSSGKRLFINGLKIKEEINLQPVVNLFSSLAKWQTTIAPETLYKDGVACANYVGYSRDEVQPFAIRLLFDDGGYTANFPFVARPANEYDLEVIDDKNFQSLRDNAPKCDDCLTNDCRDKRWQIHNTAQVTESCPTENNGTSVIESITKTCKIENVKTITQSPITINLESEFKDLKSYINDNYDQITDQNNVQYWIPTLSPFLLKSAYTNNHCLPNFGTLSTSGTLIVGQKYLIQELKAEDNFTNVGFTTLFTVFIATATTPTSWVNKTVVVKEDFCDLPPILNDANTIIQIDSIVNEKLIKTPKTASEYDRFQVNQKGCVPYVYDRDGNYSLDIKFRDDFLVRCGQYVYSRDMTNINNQTCETASDVINVRDDVNNLNSYYHSYLGEGSISELLTTKVATNNGDPAFQNNLHRGALWFKITKEGRSKIVLDITPLRGFERSDSLQVYQSSRFTIYSKCNSINPIRPSIIYDSYPGYIEIIDISSYPNTFYIAVDSPIVQAIYAQTYTVPFDSRPNGDTCYDPFGCCDDLRIRYRTAPQNGCFNIITRQEEYTKVKVSFDSIFVNKIEEYAADCTFYIPKVEECKVKPFKKGTFSFWESTVEYSDNKELYDSSNLKITDLDLLNLSTLEKNEFLSYYTNSAKDINNNYILKGANLRCKKIRHPKFPDNIVAPFMTDTQGVQKFAESVIYPLGITLDNNVVKTMLSVAKNNNLITDLELKSIVGYEILKGDNSIHKSVIGSGLGFDFFNYEKEKETFHYSNFPFNDLGEDRFHLTERGGGLIQHPTQGKSNNLFSVISPDLLLNKSAIPFEVTLQGFQFGNSNSKFVDMKEHPKWVVLGDKARRNAERLAEYEFALEVATQASNITKEASAGLSFNIGSIIAIVVYSAATIANALIKIGKYRYDWLDIFRNLGRLENFANIAVAEGKYNMFLKTSRDDDNYKRALSIRTHIGDNLYTVIDKSNGETIKINNDLRENSILISTGNYPFKYPQEYSSYDNNKVNSKSSKYLASEFRCAKDTNAVRDIASPYFTLRNNIPDQWDTIDSIKWLTTNSVFDLNDDTSCKPEKTIFGGTCYISRFTWRRKLPFFTVTAMGEPDRLPFTYSSNPNIGFTRFYCDYEIGGIYNKFSIPFPDINSDKAFDCPTGYNEYYVTPPSKFYLESHSVIDFLVESEFNCNFRNGRKEKKDLFYPYFGKFSDYVQEVPLAEPNTFFYNNTFSYPVSNTPYKFLDYTYSKEVWQKRNEQPNATIVSELDGNENDLTDPWTVFKPVNWYEYKTNLGELIGLKDIESDQFLAMFENSLILSNAIDSLAEKITPQNRETGISGIFAQRPLEFKTTELGFAGTQNTDICSTPYGHFWADMKRGRIFQIDQNGKDLQVVSEGIQEKSTDMKQWFREHLPYKILKQFPEINIDNKFKGIGLNIWYDDRNSRVFFTKRDYIAINTTGLLYNSNNGFYVNNLTPTITCPTGYVLNTTKNLCEKISISNACPTGYTYNPINNLCEKPTICDEGLDIVFILDATASQQESINNIKNSITTTIVPTIISEFGVNYRMGLVSVKDRRISGEALFDILESMTLSNQNSFLNSMNTINANGGVGIDEPSDLALDAVLNNKFSIDKDGTIVGINKIGTFRNNVAKAIILVTDEAPSGLNDIYGFDDWLRADSLASQANSQKIQIFSYLTSPLQTLPVAPILPATPPNKRFLMQNYATKTGGNYYFTPKGVGISDSVVNAIKEGIECVKVTTLPTCVAPCVQALANCNCTETTQPIISSNITPIYFDNATYFKDVSFTLAYKPQEGSWVSYYSFYPDYSPFHNNFFQGGQNWGEHKETLWNHLLNNSSFQVFRGKLNPFIIKFPIQNQNVNKMLNVISLNVETRRYQSNYDFSIWKDKGFNKFSVFTNSKHSGGLNLFPQKNLADNRNFPKTNSNNTQDILFTAVDGMQNINYFFNRVDNQQSNVPMHLKDENNIFDVINPRAVSFIGKRTLERMTGESFIVALENSKESRYNITLKNSINSETLIP